MGLERLSSEIPANLHAIAARAGVIAVAALGGASSPATAIAEQQSTSCSYQEVNGQVIQNECTTTSTASDPEAGSQSAPVVEPEADQPPEPPQPPAPKPKPHPRVHQKHYDYNMHGGWGSDIARNGCGVVALADAVSYLKRRSLTPRKIKPDLSLWYYGGAIHHTSNNPYMADASPHMAAKFGLKAYETTVSQADEAVKLGRAVIMLAAGSSIITRASHYFETDQYKNGRFFIHDPNQASGRSFDKSWRSAKWLKAHGTLSTVWVLAPKSS